MKEITLTDRREGSSLAQAHSMDKRRETLKTIVITIAIAALCVCVAFLKFPGKQ